MGSIESPKWITENDLLWRPPTVEYPMTWNDVLWLQNGNWLVTYQDDGHTYVHRSTRLLGPFIQKVLGQRGTNELREVEAKEGFNGVDIWAGRVWRAAAYAHLAHLSSLESVERDRLTGAKQLIKRVLELNRTDRQQLSDIWFDCLAWEFGRWHRRTQEIVESNDGPYRFDIEYLSGLVDGFAALEYGPHELLGSNKQIDFLVDYLVRAWLAARSKSIRLTTMRGLVDLVHEHYFDFFTEPADID